MLDLARRCFPDIEAVFVDTGLEYPEIRKFVKTKDNVTWLKPDMRFDEVIEKYGFPVISKETSCSIRSYRENTNSVMGQKILGTTKDKDGNKSVFNCDKYKFLLEAPFKISDKCCEIMKKKPLKHYAKNKKAITGSMADESRRREIQWLKKGCNAFDTKSPISNPMSFWTEQDILHYMRRNDNRKLLLYVWSKNGLVGI